MDYFLYNIVRIIIVIFIFAGCSKSPEPYKLDATLERAGSGFRSGSITEHGIIKTVFSAIYLNDIYPHYPHNQEQFLIAVYAKEDAKLYFYSTAPRNEQHSYTLTSKNRRALSSQKLEDDDPLIDLMPIHYKWATYYYVTYPLTTSIPSISLENSDGKSVKLIFKDIYKEPKTTTFKFGNGI